MAIFIAANNAVRFDLFNVAGLLTGTEVSPPTMTTFSIGPDGNNFTTFSGTGFTYSGGLFNGGTINRIDSVAAAQPEFQFDGFSMPVAQFRAFVNAGNSQGFLAAVLAGNDQLTGSVFGDYLQGFAGNDLIANDLGDTGNDTLDGGAGNDTVDGADGDDSLLGGIGIDMLAGGSGGDRLDGGIGADTMDGGDGNDFYFVDNAKDTIAADSSGIDSVQSTVSYVLAADLEHLFLTGAGKLNGTGNGSANQIAGSTGANKLLGLGGDDTLDGGDGNDTLDGGTGVDMMRGGDGNDVYFIDENLDQAIESLAGKTGGIDTVFSSVGIIILGANIENLTLIGTDPSIIAQGNDLNNVIIAKNSSAASITNSLQGLAGNDTLIGRDGNDDLDGGTGADLMNGGGGDDLYSVDDADKVIETLADKAGGLDSILYLGSKGYTLGANLEGLNLFSSTGDTFGFGNGLANSIVGNNASNTLDGKAGTDELIGMDGNDTYVVDNVLDRIDEVTGVFTGGIDTVRSSIDFNLNANATTVLGDFENLILLGKAVVGTGNTLPNQITGNAGKNNLSGFGGNDTLDGGAGADTMLGGDGDDVYAVDSKLDLVNESGADSGDQINSSKVSIDISALGAIENIALSGKLTLNAIGNGADNFITGNDGANKLVGLDGNDTLIGGAGNDTIVGGDGIDRFSGGLGNDIFIVDDADLVAADYVLEVGSGIDTVISTAKDTVLPGSVFTNAPVENLVLAAGSSASQGVGNEFANVITGNELDNKLFGVAGNDTIDGGIGNDEIEGGSGNDLINGGAGNDSILGGLGNDTIDGGAGDDTVRGGADADTFIVSSGNDTVLFSFGEGPYLIKGFDGNPVGQQDVLNLDELFDAIPVDTADRASHVLILDHGATVDVRVDADNNLANGYELTIATIQTKDAVTVGEDVLLGTL